MVASDSATNLAWLINQNAPSSRIDMTDGEPMPAKVRPSADFGSLTIDAALLDR
jgi:hypothetical protein